MKYPRMASGFMLFLSGLKVLLESIYQLVFLVFKVIDVETKTGKISIINFKQNITF